MGSLQRPHKWCDPTSMLVDNYHIILHLYYQMMFFDLYHKAKLKTKIDIICEEICSKILTKDESL
jgi:hypothetical protein